MAEAKYFCPTCASPELRVKGTTMEIKLRSSLKGLDAHCELCGWTGKVEDLIGAVSQEEFFDIEKISSILIGVCARHAAGPLCQALELIGLLEKDDQEGRNHVMRNTSAAMVAAAFQSAGTWTSIRQEAINDPNNIDAGLKDCPQCKEAFEYPYVHNCIGQNIGAVGEITPKEDDDDEPTVH